MGSITSSQFRAVSRSILCGRSVAKSLVLCIQNYQQRGNNSVPQTNVAWLKWGVMNESNGRTDYMSLMASQHRGFKIDLAGLTACRNEPFLRVSPDSIVSCSCHAESWLLEIKCPWTIKHLDPKDTVDQGLMTYIKKTGDSYHIDSEHKAGYYEQVQEAMAIAVAQMCDFVVWTPNGALALHVPFNNDYWINFVKPKLVTFFTRNVVPEISTERLRRGLVLLDTSSKNMNDSSTLTDSGNMSLDELLRACIAPELISIFFKIT
jgi:YqaJ-like viral recombinase domain